MSIPFGLAALYGVEIVVATTANVPVMGEIRLLTRTLMRVELSWDGETLTQRQEVCRVISQDDTRVAKTELPEAFARSLTPRSYPVTVTQGADGLRYGWDPGPVYVGYAPEGGQQAVPRSVDDPRVADTDGDGRPAATVHLTVPVLGATELYTVHRNHIALDGHQEGEEIRGSVTIRAIEQLTVGASRTIFNHSAEVSPVSEQSSFRMWPLPEGEDCAALRAGWTPAPHPWLE